MANKSIFTTALAVLMLGGIALAQTQPSPVQPAPVKRTIVGKADVPNSNYEAITAIVEIANSGHSALTKRKAPGHWQARLKGSPGFV